MNCSVCNRELAPDWSVCPKCGAMKNDSVREELQMSLAPIATQVKFRFADEPDINEPIVERAAAPEPSPAAPGGSADQPPVKRKVRTSGLAIKKTSPTLAEFKNRNAAMPEWRLQLQNTVRQRNGRVSVPEALSSLPAPPTSGANALKVDYDQEPAAERDARVANALRRIEQSRRTYLPTEKAREGIRVARAAQRNFPFNVVARSAAPEAAAPVEKPAAAPGSGVVRPKLIGSLKIEKKSYDTNKLVPIPEADVMAQPSAEKVETAPAAHENLSRRIEIKISGPADDPAVQFDELALEKNDEGPDEIDDLAPISMRFNAGLFDMIIGSFISLILLSPLLAFSEGWMSITGFLLFTSVLFIVMFVYLTLSIAFLGQTFGMRLFSLELVDVEQSEFPTLHQAAVNSSVYLLSLIFAGLGFVPIFFNEEKRAVHDLISGTILVREV